MICNISKENLQNPSDTNLWTVALNLLDELPKSTGGNFSRHYTNGTHDREIGFIRLCSQLERFLFNDIETKHTTNYIIIDSNVNFHDKLTRALEDAYCNRIAFIYCKKPSSQFDESRIAPLRDIKYLPAAEQMYSSNSRHFIKIFTYEKVFCIYSNKDLTLKQLAELKLLQWWTLFKKEIETPDTLLFDYLKAVANEDIKVLNETLNKAFQHPIITEYKNRTIKKLFTSCKNKRIKKIENDIIYTDEAYKDYINRASETATKLAALQEELLALNLNKEDDSEGEMILKYLRKHPYVESYKKSETSDALILKYKAPILYYDPYVIEKYIKNTHDPKRKAIYKTFLDNKYELMTQCEIIFDTTNFNIARNAIGHTPLFGHPHIDRFSCFGNHIMAISEAALNYNYFGAFEQITQAVLNLNFTDSAVINEMMANLIHNYPNMLTWRNKKTGAMLSTNEITEIYYEETKTND